MAAPLLLSLSEELQHHIFCFVDTDLTSILSAAKTCKQVHRISVNLLQRHQEYDRNFRLCHDRQPSTVPNLLRLAIKEPQAIAHIRDLEFWGVRSQWDEWKTFLFYWQVYQYADTAQDFHPDHPEPIENLSHLDYTYWGTEFLKHYEDYVRRVFGPLEISRAPRVQWQSLERLHRGNDSLLKVLLIAQAPRMRSLNIVAQEGSHAVDEVHFVLGQAISTIQAMAKPLWPPGFLSLRYVAVGTPSEHRHADEHTVIDLHWVATLLLLPNLSVLKAFNVAGGYLDNGEVWEATAPKACSAVTELTIQTNRVPHNVIRALIAASRALRVFQLESGGSAGRDNVVEELVLHHARTLEVLALPDGAYAADSLVQFERLRSVNPLPLKNGSISMRIQEGTGLSNPRLSDMSLSMVLPASIERVTFPHQHRWAWVDQQRSYCPYEASAEQDRQLLIRRIADLVKDSRYQRLAEVCLFDTVRPSARHELRRQVKTMEWEEDAIARIQAKGVTLHLWDEHGDRLTNEKHRALHREEGHRMLLETEPRAPDSTASVDSTTSESR